MSDLWSPCVKQLDPYVPGEQPKLSHLIKLNTNENPYPPSPQVATAIQQLSTASLRLYPDPESVDLRQSLAETFSLNVEQVFVGNGSDEVLGLAFKAYFTERDKPLLFPDITYSFYPVYCQLLDIPFSTVPLAKDLSIDITTYNSGDNSQGNGGIILANPNAPTGIALELEGIKDLLEQHPQSVVIIDEAYVDFGAQSAVRLIERYANLLVTQTFSKSRSLAGLRIGYALGQAELIEGLNRVKNSFNSYPLDRVAQAAGVASLQDDGYFNDCCKKIIATRQDVVSQLQSLGFECLPSAANFIFIKPSEALTYSAEQLFQQLRRHNIIVRYFSKPRIDNYLRVTIGTPQEMAELIDCLKTILS